MKWWKLCLVVFLVGIVAILGYWLHTRQKEGFQTAAPGSDELEETNAQVYVVYPTEREGQLTKEEAIGVCRRFRGELATIGQLADAAAAGAQWTTIGWTLESGFGWRAQNGIAEEVRQANPLTTVFRANAICYGAKPETITGFTILDFNSTTPTQPGKRKVEITPIPQTVADLPILQTATTSNSYKMFDLAPIYAQLEIATLEYPQLITDAQRNESDIILRGGAKKTATDNFYYAKDDNIRRIYFSYWLNPFLDTNSTVGERTTDGFQRYIGQTNQRIQAAYSTELFASHPLGYILSGEKSRRTGINCAPIFLANLPVGKINLSDAYPSESYTHYKVFEVNNRYSGFANVPRSINYFLHVGELLRPLGQINTLNKMGLLGTKWDTNNWKTDYKQYFNSDGSLTQEYINQIKSNSLGFYTQRFWETWIVNYPHIRLWNLDTYMNYLKSPVEAVQSRTLFRDVNNVSPQRLSKVSVEVELGGGNCPTDYYTRDNWCFSSSPGTQITDSYNGQQFNLSGSIGWSDGRQGPARTTINLRPQDIQTNKCYTPATEANPISPLGILTGQTWTPVLQRTDSIGQGALDAWTTLKASTAKGGETFWKTIPLVGTMSDTNKDEMNKSISYSIYFNFSNTGLTERQLRVSSDSPYRFCFSPTFNAKNEYFVRVEGNRIVQAVDPYAKLFNDTYANVEITRDFMKYIPYHASRYMLKWGDYRYNRIIGTSSLTATPYSGTRSYSPAVFNMNAPLSTIGSFTSDKKQKLLDKIAQFYYDSSTDKQRIIKSFYDCYQVADTLFDVRYEIQEKTSAALRQRISELTTQYLSLRNSPMSVVDLANLELIYSQKLKALYDEENKNIDNYGEFCSNAKSVKYVRIEANDPTKYIYLSQVVVVNNYGENVARYGQVTNSTMTAFLFDGEEETPDILRTTPGGVTLTAEQNQKYCDSKNALKRREKLDLIVDGTLRPRPPPNVFRSMGTASESILVNIGSPDQIVAVKLVLPAIPRTDSDTVYKITLLNSNFQQVDLPKFISTVSGSNSRTTTIASFLLDASDTRRSPNCPADLYNRFRTARFFATITDQGLTNGEADINKLTITGYSESDMVEETAALTFNPRYNCGFDLPIDDRSGNCIYRPKTLFTKNFTLSAGGVAVNCADPAQIQNALTEYRLSLREPGFDTRPDVLALPAAQQYTLEKSSYFPSTVLKYAQVNPSTCAFTFKEIQVDRLTNQFQGLIDRSALIRFKPDLENWYSNKILYDIPSSMMFSSESALTSATALQGKTLTSLNPPVSVPIPIQPRLSLDTGSGACAEKTCADIDVINSLASQFNNRSTMAGFSPLQILRVNRAVTVATNRCDYEVVFGDYSASSQPTGIVSTVSLYSRLNTADCSYKYIADSVGTGFFADGNQPLLSKLYTYASDFMEPIYKSLYKSISSVSLTASAQLDTTKQTIAQALGTYRTDVLGSYGALKQLDGCPGTNWSTLQNRCYAPETVGEFIKTYTRTRPFNGRMRQVLRAATASGSECDFTFETEELRVQNGAVVGGERTTRGMRCRMRKDPFNCAFTVDSAPYAAEEVYQVGTGVNAGYTYDQAAAKCRELNGRLATYNELAHAFRDGAQWCNGGWVVDSEGVVVDSMGRTQLQTNLYSPNQGGCGSSGSITATPIYTSTVSLYESAARRELRAPATCIGIKPDQGAYPDTTIANFSSIQYRSPTVAFEGCTPFVPMPPTAQDLADLGFRPTTATTSPLATVSTMIAGGSSGRQMVSVDAVPQIDFADCRSNLLVADAIAAGVSLPITTIEQVDLQSCIYNGSMRTNYSYNPATRTITTRVGAAQAATTVAAANRIAVSYTVAPPTTVNPPITGDSICIQPRFIQTLSTIGVFPLSGRKWFGPPDDNSSCDYRITDSDTLPFDRTFLRVRFASTLNALGVGFHSIRAPDEDSSRFRTLFNGSRMNTALLSNTGFQQYLSTVSKQAWNSIYDSITPDESYVRDGTGRLSTIGAYRTRMGQITGAFFSASEYAVILQASTMTTGKYGENDVRTNTVGQQFRVRLRNPYSRPNDTTLFSLESTSGYTGPWTPFSDPDRSAKSATDALTPASSTQSQPPFRMLRFRVDSPASSEITRLNFYTVGTGAVDFKCPTGATPTTTTNPGISSMSFSQAYITITGYDGLELLPGSYTPTTGICAQSFTQSLDPFTRFSTCTLNVQQVPSPNAALYVYPKPTNGAECQIGYTPTENGTKCAINYNFQDLLGPYCSIPQTTAIKRLKLQPSQWVTVNFNDFVSFNAFSVTSGAKSRVPATCSVEISMNGIQWARVATQKALGITEQLQTSRIFQFFTDASWPTGASAVQLPATSIVQEAFANPVSVPMPMPTNHPERPSWFRITVLETRDSASKYTTMGAISFQTPDGHLDPKTIKATNFGGSRKSARDGPDALLDSGSGRFWVDYNRAPLLFRFPEKRPFITGFRFATPGTLEGNGALPKRFRLESSWDGRVWTPIEEDGRAPPSYTGIHAFCRFMRAI